MRNINLFFSLLFVVALLLVTGCSINKSNIICDQINDSTSITSETLSNDCFEITIPVLIQIPIHSEIPIKHNALNKEAKRQAGVMGSMLHREVMRLVPQAKWIITKPVSMGDMVSIIDSGNGVVAIKYYFYRIEISISCPKKLLQKPTIPEFLRSTGIQRLV